MCAQSQHAPGKEERWAPTSSSSASAGASSVRALPTAGQPTGLVQPSICPARDAGMQGVRLCPQRGGKPWLRLHGGIKGMRAAEQA